MNEIVKEELWRSIAVFFLPLIFKEEETEKLKVRC